MADVVPFADVHLDAVLDLCRRQGWPSLPDDPDRARRALRAPGVTTVVALDDERVVGFAQVLSDGEIQGYLALLLVADDMRGRGIGTELVRGAHALAGGLRVDVLSEELSSGFYERFTHRVMPGYRIYPSAPGRA